MKQLIKKMKTRNAYLNIGFAMVILLLIILPMVAVFTVVKFSEAANNLKEKEMVFMNKCDDLEEYLVLKYMVIQQYISTEEPEQRRLLAEQTEQLEKRIEERHSELYKMASTKQEREFLAAFEERFESFKAAAYKFISPEMPGETLETLENYKALHSLFMPLTKATHEMRSKKIENTINYFDSMENTASNYMIWGILLSFVLLVLVIVLAYRFSAIRHKITEVNKLLRLKISEKRRAEQENKLYAHELEEMNDRKNKLISLLSHDLRSPATGLLGSAQFLCGNVDQMEKDEIKKFTQVIVNAGTRLVEQLNETLVWIRNQAVKEEFNPVKLNIRKTIDKIEKQLEENIVQKNLYFFNDSSPDHTICSDQTMFESIIRNLVSNAIKFTPAKGEIRVTSNVEGECITIRVSDTGVGMSEEKKEELFKKSVESTGGTSNEKGSGIGLMLIKEFMDKHKGEIEIDSTPGKGTVVTLKFKSSGSGIC
jgi:signal transduction histidine kinase